MQRGAVVDHSRPLVGAAVPHVQAGAGTRGRSQRNAPTLATSKPIYSCGLMKIGSSPGASRRLGEWKIEARLQWGCNWNERQTNANEEKEFFVSVPSDLSGAQGRN